MTLRCAARAVVFLLVFPVVVGAEPGREIQDPTACRKAEKAAVVFFILQDCPVANALVPAMNQIVEDFQDKGVRFSFVYVDPQLEASAAAEHKKAYRLAAPVLVDRAHEWVSKAGADVTPEAAVFTTDGGRVYCGRINNLYEGFGKKRQVVTQRDLRLALEAVLAGKKEVPAAKGKAVGCYIRDFRPREDG